MKGQVLEMAIGNEKTRVSLTVPNDALEVMKKEAKLLGLTVSQYVVMTMRANSFLGDERTAGVANYQLQRARDVAWGLDVSARDEAFPHLASA